MEALQAAARKLLEEQRVAVVIGYGEGRRGVRPIFVRDAAGCDRLLFDERCVHNLAAYLSPRRSHVLSLGRAAVVVKACDAKAVAGLIRESQLERDKIVLIGVRCGGVVRDPTCRAPLSAETVAPRCAGCDGREPALADTMVGEPKPAPPAPADERLRVEAIEAMDPDARLRLWTGILSACTRCHACRQACPLCFCERCVADKTQPAWIESSPHARGNFAWHLTRALHLAGRCVDCGECERACPEKIPLGLLRRRVARSVADRFGYRVTDNPSAPAPIGTFRQDDAQEFIL